MTLAPMDPQFQDKVQLYLHAFRREFAKALPIFSQRFNVVSFPEGALIDFEISTRLANLDNFAGEAPSIRAAFNAAGVEMEELLQEKDCEKIDQKGFSGKDSFLIFRNHVYMVMGKQDHYWSPYRAKPDVQDILDGFVRIMERNDQKKRAEKNAEDLYNKAENKKDQTSPFSRFKRILPW